MSEITERIKQNFEGLNIDANGDIEVESDDDDFDSKHEEDDWVPAVPTVTTRSRRALKQKVSLEEVVNTF